MHNVYLNAHGSKLGIPLVQIATETNMKPDTNICYVQNERYICACAQRLQQFEVTCVSMGDALLEGIRSLLGTATCCDLSNCQIRS